MRPIDADEVRKHAVETYQANGVELEPIMMVPLSVIDNAPTVAVNCKDCDGYEAGYSAGLKDADPLPTVEPRIKYGTDGQPYKLSMTNGKEYERPQGEWVEKEETPASVSYYCSVCKIEGIPITPFCPWCGAEMRGDKE